MRWICQVALAGTVLAAVFQVSSLAHAQQPAPRYQPARPVFSPYFGLFRRDAGILPNYYEFVVPRQRLYDTLQRQNATLWRQGSEIRSLQGDVQAFGQQHTAAPTGVGSVFMNYSHFYPALRSPGRR